MLDVLEQISGLITLLFVFTCQSVQSAPIEDPIAAVATPGRFQAKLINKQFNVEYLYKYAYEKSLYGSDSAKENITEFYFQETNCKRSEIKHINDTKACNFNMKGKVMICEIKSSPVDTNYCKSTGDKYDLLKTDRRSENYAIVATKAYNTQNYKPKSPLKLSLEVNVLSDLKREVITGTTNVLRFSTKEYNCTKSSNGTERERERCIIIKHRLDCEATVKEPITTINDLDIKADVDVKCQENKSPDAILAMRSRPPPEKAACRVIRFNPTATASRNVTDCLQSKPDDDQIAKNVTKPSAYSTKNSSEVQPLQKPSNSSAAVAGSLKKKDKNKTAHTMSADDIGAKETSSMSKVNQPKKLKSPSGQNGTNTKNKEKTQHGETENEEAESGKQEGKRSKSKAKKDSEAKDEDSSIEAKSDDDSKSKESKKKELNVPKSKKAELKNKENEKKEEGELQKKNEDEKHSDYKDKVDKGSEAKLDKTKPGKKGTSAANKKESKGAKIKTVVSEENEAETEEKVTDEAKKDNGEINDKTKGKNVAKSGEKENDEAKNDNGETKAENNAKSDEKDIGEAKSDNEEAKSENEAKSDENETGEAKSDSDEMKAKNKAKSDERDTDEAKNDNKETKAENEAKSDKKETGEAKNDNEETTYKTKKKRKDQKKEIEEENDGNEDEKHSFDEHIVEKGSDAKLDQTKPGKKGSSAASKKGSEGKKDKTAASEEDEAKTDGAKNDSDETKVKNKNKPASKNSQKQEVDAASTSQMDSEMAEKDVQVDAGAPAKKSKPKKDNKKSKTDKRMNPRSMGMMDTYAEHRLRYNEDDDDELEDYHDEDDSYHEGLDDKDDDNTFFTYRRKSKPPPEEELDEIISKTTIAPDVELSSDNETSPEATSLKGDDSTGDTNAIPASSSTVNDTVENKDYFPFTTQIPSTPAE